MHLSLYKLLVNDGPVIRANGGKCMEKFEGVPVDKEDKKRTHRTRYDDVEKGKVTKRQWSQCPSYVLVFLYDDVVLIGKW